MTTSGTYVYTVTAIDIVTEALEQIGVLAVGETLSPNDLSTCLRSLNMMTKQWSGNFDFAPGLKTFSRKHGYLFLQKAQGTYSIGASGDNASLSYNSTTMRIVGVSTNTTLEVTSTSGMTAGDYIGIVLDTGYIHWTTISSITDSDTLVIPSTGLPSGVAVGNRIFSYTTKLMRPLYIENATVKNIDGIETKMYPMTNTYYENISLKTVDSFPTYYKYDNTLTNGTMYFDCEPSDITNVIRLTFMATAEDYNIQTDTISYPQEWYQALAFGLAKTVTNKFEQKWDSGLESSYVSALAMARASYAETSEIYFQPGLE